MASPFLCFTYLVLTHVSGFNVQLFNIVNKLYLVSNLKLRNLET